MAKQNFISGGYYGKLGETVGQRWKNKRTIRTYVIPKNPRTAAQQANRNRFGSVIPYAQMGMAMNYEANAFDDESITRWNFRVKTARQLQDLEKTGLAAIPLSPVGFAIPYVITKVMINDIISDNSMSFVILGNTPNTARNYSLVIEYPNAIETGEIIAIYRAVSTDDKPNIITVENINPQNVTEECLCRIVSNDDTDSIIDMACSDELQVSPPEVVYTTFNTSVRSISRDGQTFKITFNQEVFDANLSIDNVTLKCVVGGAETTLTPSEGQLLVGSEYFEFQFTTNESKTENIPAFPVGSNIEIGSISATSQHLVATASDVTEDFYSTDLTREISAPSVDYSNSNYVAVFGTAIVTTPTTSNLGSASSVNNKNFGLDSDSNTVSAALDSNGKLCIYVGQNQKEPMLTNGCSLSLSACSFVAGGVTYTLAAQNKTNVTNNYRVFGRAWTASQFLSRFTDDSRALRVVFSPNPTQGGFFGTGSATSSALKASAYNSPSSKVGEASITSVSYEADAALGASRFTLNFSFASSFSSLSFSDWLKSVQLSASAGGVSCDVVVTESASGNVWTYKIPLGAISYLVYATFDLSVKDVSRSNQTFTITFNQKYLSSNAAINGVAVRGVKAGAWGIVTPSNGQVLQNGENVAYRFTTSENYAEDILAFPVNSYVSVTSASVSDSNIIASAISQQKLFTSTDLTRVCDVRSVSVTDSSNVTVQTTRLKGTVSSSTLGTVTNVNNKYINMNTDTFTPVLGTNASGFIVIRSGSGAKQPMISNGCSYTCNASTLVINGVTYTLATVSQNNVTNGYYTFGNGWVIGDFHAQLRDGSRYIEFMLNKASQIETVVNGGAKSDSNVFLQLYADSSILSESPLVEVDYYTSEINERKEFGFEFLCSDLDAEDLEFSEWLSKIMLERIGSGDTYTLSYKDDSSGITYNFRLPLGEVIDWDIV